MPVIVHLPTPVALSAVSDLSADGGQAVAAALQTWHDIETALRPVLGARGVAALFKRSLHLASRQHGWWAPVQPELQASIDLAGLRSALLAQRAAEAAAGHAGLLATFTELLASLVGASLTERLLGAAGAAAPVPETDRACAPAQSP